MKLLIFSDSHGSVRQMERALDLHPDAGAVIHLGDGAREFALLREARPQTAFISIAGNVDEWQSQPGTPPPAELLQELEGVRLLMCHGHRFDVKQGVGRYLAYARSRGAGAALFGHTHQPFERYYPDGELYLFNPGSIARPVSGAPSYGVALLRGGRALFSHGSL